MEPTEQKCRWNDLCDDIWRQILDLLGPLESIRMRQICRYFAWLKPACTLREFVDDINSRGISTPPWWVVEMTQEFTSINWRNVIDYNLFAPVAFTLTGSELVCHRKTVDSFIVMQETTPLTLALRVMPDFPEWIWRNISIRFSVRCVPSHAIPMGSLLLDAHISRGEVESPRFTSAMLPYISLLPRPGMLTRATEPVMHRENGHDRMNNFHYFQVFVKKASNIQDVPISIRIAFDFPTMRFFPPYNSTEYTNLLTDTN